jgi:ribosomal protein S12 methylthiotransferase
MGLQRRLVRCRQRTTVGQHATLMVDGAASDHELVIRGRLQGQAPEIDSVVYLTDCDPSSLRAGDLVEVQIVGGRGYDLVARPIAAADRASATAGTRQLYVG